MKWRRCFNRIVVGAYVLLAMFISLAGCQRSGGVAVQGHVSYKGEAIPNGTLTFFPATGRQIETSISEGDYNTRLMPGGYTSTVSVAVEMPPSYGRTHWNQLPPQKFALPVEYTSRAKSTLKSTVKADQSEPIDFELK
jgi:hypothetical protein